MKAIVATLAALGIAGVMSMPAQAGGTAAPHGATSTAAQVGHTDMSSQRRNYRRHYRYRPYAHRYRPYVYRGPRYGYYRPYRYYRPYYRPGVSLGFWGGPRFGVWF